MTPTQILALIDNDEKTYKNLDRGRWKFGTTDNYQTFYLHNLHNHLSDIKIIRNHDYGSANAVIQTLTILRGAGYDFIQITEEQITNSTGRFLIIYYLNA